MSCCIKVLATTTSPTSTSGCRPPANPVKITFDTWNSRMTMDAGAAAATLPIRLSAMTHGVPHTVPT
ncbi:hypothetical protein G6F53_014285 [Rhizopus delemar]|nr:hypothetical protein G6F53_014285 [Rhizopus delemar]